MTSKDDDTLPLPGFSQELSVDATIDEDFIPTSQPHSSKSSRNSDTLYNKSTEELKCSDPTSDSRIDDTLPPEAVIDQSALDKDKSTDFIPDTETKQPKIAYGTGDPACRKKLPVFGTEDIFKVQTNPPWNVDGSKVQESPALETQNVSILDDTPTVILPSNREDEGSGNREESITEIVVNDSAETVDLEATPVKKTEVGKLEISAGLNGERCEESQVFDNSSVLLLDQPGCSEGGGEALTSQRLYLEETVDDGDSPSERKTNGFDVKYSPPFAAVGVDGVHVADEKVEEAGGQLVPKEEVQLNSATTEPNSSSIVTRKIEFKLTVSCFVTLNTKTNKVLQKIILNVNETPKPKPKPVYVEPPSDNTSEKSKRHSSSSSGSVYSDKMGPFALPKRISAISDQTDSSEEDFGMLPKKANRALERVPWSNEYLLPLKMDDVLLASVENQEFLKRPNMPSPRKFKSKICNGINHLKEILESSSSEQTSNLPESVRTSPVGEETPESSEPIPPEGNRREESAKQNEGEEASVREAEVERKAEREEEEASPVGLRDGLAVFARWTDKLYYSGVLCGCLKNDRWDVKFDDGTLKTVREDFLMPAEWVKTGALVFASVDDKYESGQVADVRRGAEIQYVVELDAGKQEISVKISDLCLTDVMAGIVREKYKPLSGTPRGKADIDFDNVLSGKRLRDQRTPLRPAVPVQTENSVTKKKSSSKSKKTGVPSSKKSPKEDTGKKIVGLKSENGHLVEDKGISADSPSGTEAAETPLRAAKEARKKAKPRSLSYESEERRTGKKRGKSWLTPDGIPIAGPSGVKFKSQKNKTKVVEPPAPKSSNKTSKAAQSTEKGKRKRKLEESVDGGAKKKSMKEEDSRMKTRNWKR